MSFFVTGTDTGVGKTYLIVQLLRLLRASGLRCYGLKPICCGDRRDAEMLLAAGSEGATIDEINPLWMKTAAAPLAGSLVEQVNINTRSLLDHFETMKQRCDLLLVEGVGGWLVPITENYFESDFAAAMKLPLLVVVRNKLGCLNHTLLTLQSIEGKCAKTAGLILNPSTGSSDIASATNADVLARIIDVPILPMLTQDVVEFSPVWRDLLSIYSGGLVSLLLSESQTQV